MKTFLQLIEEQEKTKKPVVMAFGRMNPPTTGHLKLIDKVRSEAEKRKAAHTVIVSHSQDTKKNPLSGAQKVKHLKRYSPGTHFESSSKEHPTIMHHAARLHAAGHDHLIVVAGSDRVKEYHDLLHKYNGVPDKSGNIPYKFKKIEVVSAGHRDPDAEGAEGMSGTKMREHAANGNFAGFRQGVPSHVSDAHAKELMKDTRKGMGMNESVDHGLFKAIFVTGGPGSGKDIVIRECIAENKAIELNHIQAFDYLADKHTLAEKTNDFRREAIRNRGPLIINGPADSIDKFTYIREELESLGYRTMMVFVDTTDEISQERNTKLSRMMVESIRHDKWIQAQQNKKYYMNQFENCISFDNSTSINNLEEEITHTYQLVDNFLKNKEYSDLANDWLENHGRLNINDKFNRLFGEENVTKNSKSIQKSTFTKYNPSFRAASPADPSPDNRKIGTEIDDLRGNTRPRKDPNGRGHSGGAWSGVYSTEEKEPTIKYKPQEKISNFQLDKDKIKKLKRGDTSLGVQRLGRPSGVGPEYDTRAGGQGAAAGAGLGQNLYGENLGQTASNADVANFAGSPGVSVNPLDSRYQTKEQRKKKTFREFYGFQNDVESGLGGTLGGASNKEGMDTYKDPMRNIQNDYGLKIKKKKKQEK